MRYKDIKHKIRTLKVSTNLFFRESSIKHKRMALRFQWKRFRNSQTPYRLEISLTYRCQCNCQHCATSPLLEPMKKELDSAEVQNVMKQAAHLGCCRITFFGGEPLLRSDIYELIEYANSLGMLPLINTNGLLLSGETVKKLKKAGLNACDISLDSSVAEEHDQFRGYQGSFEMVIAGIRNLVAEGIMCRISTVATRQNLIKGRLEEIIELGKKLGAYGTLMNFPSQVGKWANSPEKMLTFKERLEVMKLHNPPHAVVEFPTSSSLCMAQNRTKIHVNPYGEVTPCTFIPVALGNCRNERLSVIWQRICEKFSYNTSGVCPLNDKYFREQYLGE